LETGGENCHGCVVDSLIYFDFLEGVIWLAIATAAEVPQAVRSGCLYHTYLFRSSPFYTIGVPDFESER
jgi:hypothetical protein